MMVPLMVVSSSMLLLQMATEQMLMRGRKGRQQELTTAMMELPGTLRTGPKQANAAGSMCESPMSHRQMLMVRVVMVSSTVQQLASLSASEVGMLVVTAVAILQQQQGSEAPGCGWQS